MHKFWAMGLFFRLLPLYFPRDKHEEEVALSKLPADVGDENGETVIDERKIRIKPLPVVSFIDHKPPNTEIDLPISDTGKIVKRFVGCSFLVSWKNELHLHGMGSLYLTKNSFFLSQSSIPVQFLSWSGIHLFSPRSRSTKKRRMGKGCSQSRRV